MRLATTTTRLKNSLGFAEPTPTGGGSRRGTMARTDATPTYFPSQGWFDEYREPINDDNAYAEAAADWGVDFDGDFVFEMREMPVDDLEAAAMPDGLAAEPDRYVSEEDGDHVGYALLGLEGGECTDARLLEDP